MFQTTIVALATAPFNSAIHIIRVSGTDAYKIINKCVDKKVLVEGYKIQMVNFIDDKKEIIDNVLLMKFKAPKSFTGEDSIEINCHGGIYLANKIITILISNGAHYAQSGEFSKRALFNNKMTLVNAESINNLINADNDLSIKIAINGIRNKLNLKIDNLINDIFMLIGQAEVNIDYPEYDDVVQVTNKKIVSVLTKFLKQIDHLIIMSNLGIKIKNGFNIAIVGEPNVGKSSFLNRILNENKAIVSNVPGTTRDVVEGKINFKNLTFNFLDTAGIRQSHNEIEKMGVIKTKEVLKKADFIIFMLDATKKFDKNQLSIYNQIKDIPHLSIINKSDLKIINNYEGIKFSAKKDNPEKILDLIIDKLSLEEFYNSDLVVLQNARQIGILNQVKKLTDKIIDDSIKLISIDLLVQDIYEIYELLKSIGGDKNDINFLDKLFANFCLGK